MPNRTLVIAEPGCTHEGSKEALIRLLETAASCGADVFKPQWTSNPVRMCERRHIGPDHPKRAYYERAYSWLAFPLEWHAELSERAKALGMQYACTSFLPEDVATVDPFIDAHKISSFEGGDAALIEAATATQKPVVISRGMADGLYHPFELGMSGRYLVLQCVSCYPAPLESMSLAVLRWPVDDQHWHGFDGLSDHSRNVLTGAVAVGAGAEVIEAHFRLDDCDSQNPDYAVAFSPAEFTEYIKNIRLAEQMMGDGIKRVQECEREMLAYRVTA